MTSLEKKIGFLIKKTMVVFPKLNLFVRRIYTNVQNADVSVKVLSKSNENEKTPDLISSKELTINKTQRMDIDKIFLELVQYDIVSFDIFGTLVYRAFPDPKVIFDLLGNDYKIQYSRKMRSDSEKLLRANLNLGEATLLQIHSDFSNRCGLNLDDTMDSETRLEYQFCFANPYMKKLYDRLKEAGKTIIIVSDMYLPHSCIENILNKCGYNGYDKLYISGDHQLTKKEGHLFRKVMEDYGTKSYAHIGDDKVSDVVNATTCGWSAYYYKNCNEIGAKYRPKGMSSLGGGLYRGIVNLKLYCGLTVDKYYAIGFAHFGLLVYGFCSWLKTMAEENNIDLIMFASRDMYYVKKIFDSLYPNKCNEYVYVSRLSILRADFKKSTEMFLVCLKEAMLYNPGISYRDYFKSIDCASIIEILSRNGVKINEPINNNTIGEVKDIILRNKEEIQSEFEIDLHSAQRYYKEIYDRYKPHKILFVDLNGRCTSPLGIQHIYSSMNIDVDIICAQLYSISDKGFTEIKMSDKSLSPYLFSYFHNRDLYDKFKKSWKNRTNTLESIFSEPSGTLLSYGKKDSNSLIFAESNNVPEYVEKINEGILDFCNCYNKYAQSISPDFLISAYDAFIPYDQIADKIASLCPELFNDLTLGR